MQFQAVKSSRKFHFQRQHLVLPFKKFYMGQVAKNLFGNESLKEHPEISDHLFRSMTLLDNPSIKKTDQAVILDAKDNTQLMVSLSDKVTLVKGKEDYIDDFPGKESILLPGGHVTPLESPQQLMEILNHLRQ